MAIGLTRPSGGRMIATALRDTDAAWLPFISAFSRGEILAHILKTRAAIQDRETIESLDALSTKIVASIGKT